MMRLASILYAIVATTFSGSLIVAVLVMGYTTLIPILIAAAVGAVLAVPASIAIARAIMQN